MSLQDFRSQRVESLCEAAHAYLHHLFFVDVDVDGAKRVANALDLGGVVRHGHLFLAYVVQLFPELKLACGCVFGENLLEIFPRLFGRLGVANVAKHVVVYTCYQAVQHPTRSLLPRWVVGVCDFRFVFLCADAVKLLRSSLSLGSELPICVFMFVVVSSIFVLLLLVA